MLLSEPNRQTLLLVTMILALVCFFSSFLLFVCAAYVKIKIDSQMTLIETYNSNVLPGIFVFVGVLNLIQNVSTVFISFKLMDVESREKIMVGVYPVLIGGIILVLFELGSSIASFVHISILDNEFGEGLNKAMDKYIEGGELKREMDSVQISFRCCGDKAYTDWFKYSWLEIESVRTSGDSLKKYLQSDGKYYSDDTPFSCCDMRSPRPCIHHHVHDAKQHHLYNFNVETTLHSVGCREALMAIYGNVLLTVGLIALGIACVKICVLLLFRLLQTSLFKARDIGDWEATTNAYLYTEGPEDPDAEKLKDSEDDDSGVETGGTGDDSSTSLAESESSAVGEDETAEEDDTAGDEAADGTDFDFNQSYNLPGVWQGYFMPSYVDQGLNDNYSFPVYTRSSNKINNLMDKPIMDNTPSAGKSWSRTDSEPIQFPNINLNAKDVGFPQLEQAAAAAQPTGQDYCMQLFQPFRNLPEITGTGDTIGPSLIDKIKAHISGGGGCAGRTSSGRGYGGDPFKNYRYSMLRHEARVGGDSDDENNNRNNEVAIEEASSGNEKSADAVDSCSSITSDVRWRRQKHAGDAHEKAGLGTGMKSIPTSRRLLELEYNEPGPASSSTISDHGFSPMPSLNTRPFCEQRKNGDLKFPVTFYQENEFTWMNKGKRFIARKNTGCEKGTRVADPRGPAQPRVLPTTRQDSNTTQKAVVARKPDGLPTEQSLCNTSRCYANRSPPSSTERKTLTDASSDDSSEGVRTTRWGSMEVGRDGSAVSLAGNGYQRQGLTETTKHCSREMERAHQAQRSSGAEGAHCMPSNSGNAKIRLSNAVVTKQMPSNLATSNPISKPCVYNKHMTSDGDILNQIPSSAANTTSLSSRTGTIENITQKCGISDKMTCSKKTTNLSASNSSFPKEELNNDTASNEMSIKFRTLNQTSSNKGTSYQTLSNVKKYNHISLSTDTTQSNVNAISDLDIQPDTINVNKSDVISRRQGPDLVSNVNLSMMTSSHCKQNSLLKFRQRISDKFKTHSDPIVETRGEDVNQTKVSSFSQSANRGKNMTDLKPCSSKFVNQTLHTPPNAALTRFHNPTTADSSDIPNRTGDIPGCLRNKLKDSSPGFLPPKSHLTSGDQTLGRNDTLVGPIQIKSSGISFSMPGSPPISCRFNAVSRAPQSSSLPCVSRNHVRSFQKQMQRSSALTLSCSTTFKSNAPRRMLIENNSFGSAPKGLENRSALSTVSSVGLLSHPNLTAVAKVRSAHRILSGENLTNNADMASTPGLKLSEGKEHVSRILSNTSLASTTSSLVTGTSPTHNGNVEWRNPGQIRSEQPCKSSHDCSPLRTESTLQSNDLTNSGVETPQQAGNDCAMDSVCSTLARDQPEVRRVDLTVRKRVDENGRPVISPFY